ncbi:MAG: sensor histidine kinase, partial [Bacteroidales bacterium]|nr:sensor histidine kinase [Bacteroidales bacterium]
MKLTYKIASKTLLALLIILPIWAILFYFAIMNEITDEVDDNLEEYSKEIIKRSLSGEEITTAAQLSNNSYGIVELPEQEAV